MNRYYAIYQSKDMELQVSCNSTSILQDYYGSDKERINDLVDDHLKYVNIWAGTLDFSYSFNALEEMKDLDNFILVQLNDNGNYTRVN